MKRKKKKIDPQKHPKWRKRYTHLQQQKNRSGNTNPEICCMYERRKNFER
jgi:hypothetical protein